MERLMQRYRVIIPAILLLLPSLLMAFTEEQERWLEEDGEFSTADVNEGELEFLPSPPPKAVHTLHSEFTLAPSSLKDGWVEFRQCHRHLDAVPSLQVTYQYRRIRRLRLESHKHIGRIWIEGQSVQLQEVGKQAAFCVRAQIKLLQSLPNGMYQLNNGPFYRSFLDGYYPFHVIVDIHQPRPLLSLSRLSPAPQPGLTLSHLPGTLRVEAWFRGRLTLEYLFTAADNR
jgi:hypothetical protein